MVKVIGLTGGIASGKSTVAGQLKKLGAAIIDADEIAHQVIEPQQPAWKEIVEAFGTGILSHDNTIDRKKLGQIVFDDPARLKQLNSITHPHIREKILQAIQQLKNAGARVIVLDIPLLYETGWDKMTDEVWVVWLDRETQIERLMQRDGLDRLTALKRIASQMSLDKKASRADVVIDNSGKIEETLDCVTRYYKATIPRA
ncbi:MAG: dephospho-CoA kinase [Syntrophomonadaceae bacterium]|jgi:dephospho-CoA kinase